MEPQLIYQYKVTAAWSSNVLTISGTPSVAGTFAYSVPLTGGCGTVAATGTITVTDISAPTAGTITQPTCSRPGSFTIDNYQSTSTYTFTPFAYVDTTNGFVTLGGSTFPGTNYTFTETNASGCISPASANITITAPPCTDPRTNLPDRDGDGIKDVDDLDDDNDGIVDTQEGLTCVTSGITSWDPLTGVIGSNQVTSQGWLNNTPESSLNGASFSNFSPVMPSGRRAGASPTAGCFQIYNI